MTMGRLKTSPTREVTSQPPHTVFITYEAAGSHTRRSQLTHSPRSDISKGINRNVWMGSHKIVLRTSSGKNDLKKDLENIL